MSRAVHVSYLRGRSQLLERRRHTICAARKEHLEPDWQDFFDSLDSDDLGLEGLFEERAHQMAEQPKPLGSCYGCGVQLQMQDPAYPGFVDECAYAQRKKHRHENTLLCARYRLACVLCVTLGPSSSSCNHIVETGHCRRLHID